MPNTLPPKLDAALTERLDPGETVAWAGQPNAATLAMRSVPFALVGALGLAAVVQWGSRALWTTPDGRSYGTGAMPFILFGIPLFILAIGFLLAPLAAWRRAKSTAYAVTNIRVLVVHLGGGNTSRFAHEIADAASRSSRIADVVVTLTATETRADFATETLSAVVKPDKVVEYIRGLVEHSN